MTHRILITGAGGAAAVGLLKHLADDAAYELLAGDVDPMAAGLYLVPEGRRFLLPRGDAPDFAEQLLALCVREGASAVLPTVDAELLPVAEHRAAFEAAGVRCIVAAPEALRACLDKAELMALAGDAAPRTATLDDAFDASDWTFPVLAKPRSGSGGRGIRVLESEEALRREPRTGRDIVQTFLPGMEYSVDVYARADGQVLAAVPRERLKVDSGVAVAARTVHDEDVQRTARQLVTRLGLTGVCNVQLRRDVAGVPRLLEINARFPGTMAITIASGVDMPRLWLREALDGELVEGPLDFEDTALVRTWTEHVLGADELLTATGTQHVSVAA